MESLGSALAIDRSDFLDWTNYLDKNQEGTVSLLLKHSTLFCIQNLSDTIKRVTCISVQPWSDLNSPHTIPWDETEVMHLGNTTRLVQALQFTTDSGDFDDDDFSTILLTRLDIQEGFSMLSASLVYPSVPSWYAGVEPVHLAMSVVACNIEDLQGSLDDLGRVLEQRVIRNGDEIIALDPRPFLEKFLRILRPMITQIYRFIPWILVKAV